ncbi:chlorophyll A-B binding protein [Artemisia annua]|uniref:Chlorophyll a-b binding protein, chloroplastic n=1 Tax=Artemisia annua TaxID=35608 RepID=A0A2U1NR04_ARTAN|nr:chlorophyll A-B binding protein [Artemisia annua]
MYISIGRSSHILSCSCSSSIVKHGTGNSANRTSFGTTTICPPTRWSRGSRHLKTAIHAQDRPTWLPGLDPPPYLDGSLAGDFGFDPLGLGEDPESLKWYVQAELVHCRFAMAGVAGILFTDLLRVTGISDLPVWYEAGATKFSFASTRTLFIIQLLLMGFVETKRYMDFTNPGSQAKEGSFFGLEAALEGLEPGYPGGPLLNPLGLAKDIKNAHEWKLKEIKNGNALFLNISDYSQTPPLTKLARHRISTVNNTRNLAGDFGFDPLGLGEDPESLKWYVQAELVHCRFAMAGVAGILFTDLLRVTGISDLPVWYEAGATKFSFASTRTLFIIQLLLMGFVETKRYMDFTNPGSQAKEGSFFGLEAALEGLEPGYRTLFICTYDNMYIGLIFVD